jgi:iron complex transport system ATP-binding protein
VNSLETRSLILSYGNTVVMDQLNLAIPKEKISVLIGANGSGKSTLLRSLARLLKPAGGAVLLDGKEITRLPTKEVAKRLAILPQSPVSPEGLTVLQLVRQGRYPHQSFFRQWSEKDEQAVKHALEATGLADLAEEPVDSLSGGQRQRAWIAMILAQETEIILLDEPTTYLDLAHQIEILDLLRELNRKQRRTIVMVLHDLNLACRYADHIIAVHGRGVVAQGKPAEIITPALIETVFGLRCRIIEDPICGTPLCIPYSRSLMGQTGHQA